jgi:hypothetical protein
MFSDRFDVLMSKIKKILKKYFNIFLSEKHFKPPLLPQFQIRNSSHFGSYNLKFININPVVRMFQYSP